MFKKRNVKKILICTLICSGFLFNNNVTSAEILSINAVGEYAVGDNETENFSTAKDKAKELALRSAIEQAGVYVESYSKSSNHVLTLDEVRTIAGQIVKINSEEITPNISTDGKHITFVCKLHVTIDTDKIDNALVIENVNLKERISKLNLENIELRKKFIATQNEIEKASLKENIIKNDTMLASYYIKDGANASYINNVISASKEPNAVDNIYSGMLYSAFSSSVETNMLDSGWSKKVFRGGLQANTYSKKISPDIEENIHFRLSDFMAPNSIIEDISVSFTANDKALAEEIYNIAFSTYEKYAGLPSGLTDYSAYWQNESSVYGMVQIRIMEPSEYNNGYSVTISRSTKQNRHNQESQESLGKLLKYREGDWFDENGTLQLSIHNGYVNGCQVVAGYDFAGGGFNTSSILRLREKNGFKEIYISPYGYNLLNLNHKIMLRNSPQGKHNESVSGIFIGMSKNEVIKLHGEPVSKLIGTKSETWVYDNLGVKVNFDYSMVTGLILLNYGSWHFDKTGLNYLDSIDSFSKAYNAPQLKEFNYRKMENNIRVDAGPSEYIWFTNFPRYLQFTFADN